MFREVPPTVKVQPQVLHVLADLDANTVNHDMCPWRWFSARAVKTYRLGFLHRDPQAQHAYTPDYVGRTDRGQPSRVGKLLCARRYEGIVRVAD